MDLSLPEFLALSDREKAARVGDRAVLYAQQFDRAQLDALCRLADAARDLHRHPEGRELMGSLLKYRMALNFFVQPSSRTFMSFNTAQAYLGMSRMSVRDVKISSMSKGESLVDSVRTFISYVDLVVMRHGDENAAAAAFWTATRAHRRITLDDGEERPVPIVSGGSGTKQHPTQALLDIYTLQRSLEPVGGLDGKTLLLVGDLARGRTVRSLSYLMRNYTGIELVFAAPERYQMLPDILAFLDAHGIEWRKAHSISEAVAEADAVYMTRIQDEYDDLRGPGHEAAGHDFVFTREHLGRMKPTACLMHPLPKRDEIEPEIDYVDDPRVVYWRQERNGMWMRVAILARLFRVGDRILRAAV